MLFLKYMKSIMCISIIIILISIIEISYQKEEESFIFENKNKTNDEELLCKDMKMYI